MFGCRYELDIYVKNGGANVVFADEESVELLKEFQKDSEPIVAQSCDVALCMVDLERSGKPFEVCFLLGQFNYISFEYGSW
jgi:hypothetical protein